LTPHMIYVFLTTKGDGCVQLMAVPSARQVVVWV
jgi:hypothetical protein